VGVQSIANVTPEQYLEAERRAEFKSEYFDGHVYAMSGGSYWHAFLILSMGGELRQALKGKPCKATSSEARLWIAQGGLYTYPDLMVVCGEAKFADHHRDTLLNPTLIVEVLSKSTEAQDRGFKVAQYRKLDSLEEYALVSQSEPRIEKFRREPGGQWVLSESEGLEAVCHFESIDCRIALKDVYDKVTFSADDTGAAG
jgi:Uma2 family endonuclease